MRVVGNRLRHNFPISPFQTQRSDSALPDYHVLQLFARTWRRRFLRIPKGHGCHQLIPAVHPCAQLLIGKEYVADPQTACLLYTSDAADE